MLISWSKERLKYIKIWWSKYDGVQIYVSRSFADVLGKNPQPLGMLITYYLYICEYICDLQHEDWYRIYSNTMVFTMPNIGGTLTTILGIVLEISCSNDGHRNSQEVFLKTQQNTCIYWLVVEPTHLKNMSQIGNLPQGSRWKFQKYLSCHHPDMNQHREREDSRMGVHHEELLWFQFLDGNLQRRSAGFYYESKLRSATCTTSKHILRKAMGPRFLHKNLLDDN